MLGQRRRQLVLRDSHRLARVAERVLDDNRVASFAQNDSDGGAIIRVAQLCVDGRQIEIHLAGEIWFEILDCQFNDHKASEAQLVEQEIEIIFLPTHFELVLAAHKGKRLAEI